MNRIFTEQLTQSLNNKLAGLYYLIGQDPLLLSESQDNIIQAATKSGFDEKLEIQIDNGTNWNDLFERFQSMGLFFSKQVITLHFPENPTALLSKNLAELISLLNSDLLLILHFGKLTKLMEKQDWFIQSEQYDRNAVLVNCQTPTAEQLPRWVANRCKAMGLIAEQDAVQLLCYSYENNLLALKQTLQLLDLLHADHKLTFVRVKNIVEQSSVFTPFQWIDALLEGKEARARRILTGLQAEDVQPIILLRSLQRELTILLQLAKPQHKTASVDSALPVAQLREGFDRLKIWQNRRPLFTQAFQRLTYRKLYLAVQQLAELERLAKQEFSADIWDQLANIIPKICR
ncbi:DNA polymerase III subunit delta [Basfia succiniciproducens]|uniref:DNA polymerase III subunit delta n=1 Tax=Basfia succiniciproducens TaxID=653940 RepID=UPI0008CE90B3|nr:DNA polymerase III subunit delta [Basfia succiniciproducens]SEQ03676.1 DNA polymerase III, delta subunit [Basfia succiniciproducens]